jgi:hypothetical protein
MTKCSNSSNRCINSANYVEVMFCFELCGKWNSKYKSGKIIVAGCLHYTSFVFVGFKFFCRDVLKFVFCEQKESGKEVGNGQAFVDLQVENTILRLRYSTAKTDSRLLIEQSQVLKKWFASGEVIPRYKFVGDQYPTQLRSWRFTAAWPMKSFDEWAIGLLRKKKTCPILLQSHL